MISKQQTLKLDDLDYEDNVLKLDESRLSLLSRSVYDLQQMLSGDLFTGIKNLLADGELMTSMLTFVRGVSEDAEKEMQDANVDTEEW